MSGNTNGSEQILTDKQYDELYRELQNRLNELPDNDEMVHMDYVHDFGSELIERVLEFVSVSEKGKASEVHFNALVNDNRRGGSISISWGEYGGFYWLNRSFTKRLCIGWLAITYWPIDLDEMIERLLH